MVLEQGVSLREAFNRYWAALKEDQRGENSQAVDRFIRWCGRDRGVRELTPPVIAEYGEWVAQETDNPASRLAPVRDFLSFLKKSDLVPVGLVSHLRAPRGKRSKGGLSTRGSQAQVELTADGHSKLQARLELLKGERVSIIGDISRAMADKDFKENAPLDAAKERQSQIESTIRELEETLNRAVIRGPGQKKVSPQVKLGCTVELRDLGSGKVMRYILVDVSEADPGSGKLSAGSPVGRAVLDKAQGDEVSVAAPRGAIRYRIQRVKS